MLPLLSIVTITYNNPEDFIRTYNSLGAFRKAGGTHIIVNGGASIKQLIEDDCVLLEEPDDGIYDALNKGIEIIQTPYFMLIHSGDFFVSNLDVLVELLNKMHIHQLDILLNDCTIEFGGGKRPMTSKNWSPWMFKFGAQPPHPPTIYRYDYVKYIKYDTNHPIIADFDYLERIFKNLPNYDKGNHNLIQMSAGGKTSSGLSSFIAVNRAFKRLKGTLTSYYFMFTRPLIKIIQMI